VLGQLAEIHADAFKDGEKKDLFHGLIYLDEEKFLKPDFGYNNDNIVYVIVSTFSSCDMMAVVYFIVIVIYLFYCYFFHFIVIFFYYYNLGTLSKPQHQAIETVQGRL